MDIRRRLALNIRRIRKQKGLSQEALAFEAGVHRTYISGVERCVRNPTITVVDKIARALEVSAATLLSETK